MLLPSSRLLKIFGEMYEHNSTKYMTQVESFNVEFVHISEYL